VLTEYENLTQKVLFGNAILAALMSERKYYVIPQYLFCGFRFENYGPRKHDNNLESLRVDVVCSYKIERYVQPLGIRMLEIPYARQLI
jgi:hypothetical protein